MARLSSHGLRCLVVGLLAAAACSKGARSPEEAYRRFSEAVTAADGARLFDALELDTRWSWMSVQRAHREAYDILLSNHPEGAERERQLKRFEAGALAQSARDLFVRELDQATWLELRRAVGERIQTLDAARAEVALASGQRFPFRKDPGGKWGWGYAGLAEQGEQVKRRAAADLDLIRTNAADHERAAAREQAR